MLEISSEAVSFTCSVDKNFPKTGQQASTHFNIPRFGLGDSSDIIILTRAGRVYRIDTIDKSLSRIVVQFDEPLSFKPGKLEAMNLMLVGDSSSSGSGIDSSSA